ncbi:MAG: hypothetical protein U0892_05810 [Pirellulales bacterium]
MSNTSPETSSIGRRVSVSLLRRLGVFLTVVLLLALVFFSASLAYRNWSSAESTSYGIVDGSAKDTGINGLGAFQKMLTANGSRCLTATRLSRRLDRMDAIILVGRTMDPPGIGARDWLEEWLAGGKNRTVIYFGRDFDAEEFYRENTLRNASDEDRGVLELDLALLQSKNASERNQEASKDTFCRWFYLRSNVVRKDVKQFSGPWARDIDSGKWVWPVRTWLEPPRKSLQKTVPTFATGSPWMNPIATGSQNSFRSDWSETEIDGTTKWDAEWDKAPDFQVLLADQQGGALVTKLTDRRYQGGKIIVVANGYPFLNGSLVATPARQTAAKLVNELAGAKKVVFIPYEQYGLIISQVDEDLEGPVGMAFFTVWPMSMITMHGALLGIIICMVLIPILGRPQRAKRVSLSNFGHHVEAGGKILERTGDESFALKAIAGYMTQVRGDALPPWLKSRLDALPAATEPAPAAQPASLVQPVATQENMAPFDRSAGTSPQSPNAVPEFVPAAIRTASANPGETSTAAAINQALTPDFFDDLFPKADSNTGSAPSALHDALPASEPRASEELKDTHRTESTFPSTDSSQNSPNS